MSSAAQTPAPEYFVLVIFDLLALVDINLLISSSSAINQLIFSRLVR